MKLMGYQWFWLVCFAFLATIGIWLRSSVFGYDSFASVSAVCFDWFDTLGGQPGANIVWGLLPCNLFVFKLLISASAILCIVTIFYIVEQIYGDRLAWLSTFLLVGLSPIVLFEFGQFENELFAYPLILLGVFWLVKKNYLFSSISFVSSLFFWFWPFYLIFFNFGSTGGAVEQSMFAGLLNFWLLLPFLFVIPLLKGRLKWFGLAAMVLWLWNAKFFVFLLPFLGLAVAEALNLLETHLNKHHQNSVFSLKYLYILAFFCLFGWNIAFVFQSPAQNDWDAINKVISLSVDTNLPVFNDWSYGYWFWSKGLKVSNTPGTGGDVNYFGEGIYLTDQNLPCVLIEEKKEFARKEKKIWQCN